MEFEWDENKNQSNIIKHAIDFIDAAHVLDQGDILIKPSRFSNEERFVAIGYYNKRHIAIVYTTRGNTYRIISARAARKKEKMEYEKEIKKRKDSEI